MFLDIQKIFAPMVQNFAETRQTRIKAAENVLKYSFADFQGKMGRDFFTPRTLYFSLARLLKLYQNSKVHTLHARLPCASSSWDVVGGGGLVRVVQWYIEPLEPSAKT